MNAQIFISVEDSGKSAGPNPPAHQRNAPGRASASRIYIVERTHVTTFRVDLFGVPRVIVPNHIGRRGLCYRNPSFALLSPVCRRRVRYGQVLREECPDSFPIVGAGHVKRREVFGARGNPHGTLSCLRERMRMMYRDERVVLGVND